MVEAKQQLTHGRQGSQGEQGEPGEPMEVRGSHRALGDTVAWIGPMGDPFDKGRWDRPTGAIYSTKVVRIGPRGDPFRLEPFGGTEKMK